MTPKLNINVTMPQFMTDKNLLGVDPVDFSSWLTFWRAVEALEPEPGDFDLFARSTGRSKWPEKPAKIIVAIVGRRGMKSANASMKASKESIGKHPLARGEWCTIALVDPTRVQARINRDYISSYFHESPYLRSLLLSETTDTITLKNRTRILVMTSDFKSVRGFACKLAVLDEACFLGSEGARSDTECVRAFLPSLATLDGTLLVFSSPHGKWGYCWDQYQKYWGMDDSNVLIWKSPSIVMNPRLSREMIDEAINQDPQSGKSEWLAEFRDDLASYITAEIIDSCTVYGCHEIAPRDSVTYFGFTDMAGGSGKDSATLAVAHSENGKAILDCLRETKPPFSPEQVVEEFSNILNRYRCQRVHGDKYAGDWPKERFSQHGIQYEPETRSKAELYVELLPLLNSGQAELLDSDTLRRQLRALERRTHAGGRQSVDHPRSGKDDVSNAACGALVNTFEKRMGLFTNLNRAEWRFEHDRFQTSEESIKN